MPQTLTKQDRIYGKTDVSNVINNGKWSGSGSIRYCCLIPGGADCHRMMVSVPKKFFKRAVKRNLLKRRIRESYRLQKDLLPAEGIKADIMFVYNSKDILPFSEIRGQVADILTQIAGKLCK